MLKHFFIMTYFFIQGFASATELDHTRNLVYAIVTPFEANLFNQPSFESGQIVQKVYRGDRITLNPLSLDSDEEFYQTYDRTGALAYIWKEHVKVIYRDHHKEVGQKISPFREHDPTDYRLIEPLPPNYPFLQDEKIRLAQFQFALGPGRQRGYSYPDQEQIARKDYGKQFALHFSVYPWPLDDARRFHFGLHVNLQRQRDAVDFENGVTSRESYRQWALGPMISYDFWRTAHHRLQLSAALLASYDYYRITQQNEALIYDRRFIGGSIVPKFSTNWVRHNFLPHTHLIVGLSALFYHPQKLTSKDPYESGFAWNQESDHIRLPFDGQFLFNIGLSVPY